MSFEVGFTWSAAGCLAVVAVAGACSGSRQVPERPAQRGSMLRGDRGESAERRTAKSRPHPWDEGHGPFESDRLAVGAARSHQHEAHRRQHQARAGQMERFSHPACEGLSPELRRTCPFTRRRWRAVQDLPQGVELRAKGKFQGAPGRTLRLQILCHIAYGRGEEMDHCPLHVDGVRASTHIDDDAFVLRLETGHPDRVGELQDKAKDLN